MAPRILVADDSVTIQKVVELTFSKENVTLLQARNGEDAIRKATEERPDLILLDLVMPDKNGYEVCAAVRAVPILRAVPIILLTGTFEAFDRDRAVQVGANDFITKPFESQQLISKVRQQLFARTVDAGTPAATPAAPKPAAPPSAARPAAAAAVSPAVPLRPEPPEPKAVPSGETPRQPAAAPPRPAPASPTAPATPPSAAKPAGKAPLSTPSERGMPASGSPLGMAAAGLAPAGMPGFVEPPPRPEPAREARAPQRDVPQSPPPLATLAPSAPAGPIELRLEDVAKVEAHATAPVPEPISLDDLLGTAERSAPPPPPLGGTPVTPASPPSAPPPPEAPPTGSLGPPSKSVDLGDLLVPSSPASAQGPPPDQAGVQPGAEMPVFDLSADMGGPALPLIEVGTGEPPVLSVEDLIGIDGPKSEPRPERAPSAPGGLSIEPPAPSVPTVEPVADLTADAGGPEQAMIEGGGHESPALSVEDLMSGAAPSLVEESELPLPELEHEPPASAPETVAPPTVAPSAAPEIELDRVFEEAAPGSEPPLGELPGLERIEVPVPETEPPTFDLPQEAVEARPAAPLPGLETEPVFEPVVSEAAQPAEPLASIAAPATVPGLGAEEIASMRDAVTERVARELARDLSDKLVERIERIVWEVVPEMAEILIAKEIERIRAMADGQNIS
jgi:CheY-like chemotaxis protein